MAHFSWLAQDTGKPALNATVMRKGDRLICMFDNKGNCWQEKRYKTNGIFQGKDFFELLAQMNGLKTRTDGLRLFFEDGEYLSPNIAESPDWVWVNEKPEREPDHGCHYDVKKYKNRHTWDQRAKRKLQKERKKRIKKNRAIRAKKGPMRIKETERFVKAREELEKQREDAKKVKEEPKELFSVSKTGIYKINKKY